SLSSSPRRRSPGVTGVSMPTGTSPGSTMKPSSSGGALGAWPGAAPDSTGGMLASPPAPPSGSTALGPDEPPAVQPSKQLERPSAKAAPLPPDRRAAEPRD